VNAADQQDDPKSMLNFYKEMLRVRKENPALVFGEYTPLLESSNDVFAFLRQSTSPQQTCLVVINFFDTPQRVNIRLPANALQCVYSTHRSVRDVLSPNDIQIEPFEILIADLTS
jgi:glycosidase